MLVDVPAGESPAGGTRSVATVVIPNDGKGDRSVESLGVKVLVGRARRSVRSAKGGEQLDRPQQQRTGEAAKTFPRLKRMTGHSGVPSLLTLGEGQRHRRRN
jgi:hypothetical protein